MNKTITAFMMALGLTGVSQISYAQQNSNISFERIYSDEDRKRIRGKSFYELPGDVTGQTLGEIYDKGNFFSKTFLDKDINAPFNLKAEYTIKSWDDNSLDLGIGKKFSDNEGSFISTKLLPIRYANNKFNQVTNVGVAGRLNTENFIPQSNLEGFLGMQLGENLGFDPKVTNGEVYFNFNDAYIKGLQLGAGVSLPRNQSREYLPDAIPSFKVQYFPQ